MLENTKYYNSVDCWEMTKARNPSKTLDKKIDLKYILGYNSNTSQGTKWLAIILCAAPFLHLTLQLYENMYVLHVIQLLIHYL